MRRRIHAYEEEDECMSTHTPGDWHPHPTAQVHAAALPLPPAKKETDKNSGMSTP
jgi:hypothetical protein